MAFGRLSFILVVMLSVTLVQRPHAEEAQRALYKSALEEGQLILWSPADSKGIRLLTETFNRRFPGIKVNHFEIRPDDYVSRAIAEARQNRVSFDVGTGRMVALAPLLERGLVQAHDDWTRVFGDLNPSVVSRKGSILSIYVLLFPIAYNSAMLKPAEAPISWEDLLDPKWQQRIIIEPRANAFGYLGLVWGKDKLIGYMERLRANKPIYVRGGTAVAQQLVAGVAPLAVGTYLYNVQHLKVTGAPVDWARNVSPIAATENVTFVMKGAKHPSAAKLFAGWLATQEAQNLIDEMTSKGITPPGTSFNAAEQLQKSGIELVKETLENYEQAVALNRVAVKTLGVLK